ncbi:hypothetical protein H6G35_26185 [Aulosira sp. FACHB-113]|uniref:hypothetical protein n=1 Tax=Tolypothrix tenuis TaxID=457083 RepID=UPI000BBBA302|nr:hypothetical protein [Aulosira sp. FACHB-113]
MRYLQSPKSVMHHWLMMLNFHPGLPPIGRGLKALLCHSFETRNLEQGAAGQMRSHILLPESRFVVQSP